jgi:hypothetical protein
MVNYIENYGKYIATYAIKSYYVTHPNIKWSKNNMFEITFLIFGIGLLYIPFILIVSGKK